MTEAFICDAVRTPFGRYGGALRSVRTDDLAAIPIAALIARNPRRRLVGGRRRVSSAAPTRPARTTATSRGWRRCSPACRSTSPARPSTGCAVRGSMRSRSRRARSRRAKADLDRRRRRREHDARAVRRRQGGERRSRAASRCTTRRSAGVSSIRSSKSATASTRWPRRPKTSRRNTTSRAPIKTRSRLRSQARAAAALRSGRFAARDRAGDDSAEEGRAGRRRHRRAAASRHDARGARQTEADRPARRHA